MLTHAQASHNAGLCIEKMLTFMRRHGQHFPVLYVLNRGRPVDVAPFVNESVISQDHEDRDEGDPAYRVYRSAMGFQLHGPADEANIQKAADTIARELNPDAMALIMACLYAEYDEGQNRPDDLNAEPDSFRVLHVCYWLRENPEPMVTTVPYVLSEEGDAASMEWNSMEENEVNHGVAAVVFPWSRPPRKMKPMILDPYRHARR